MLSICFALNITPNDLFHDLLTKEFPVKNPMDYTKEEIEHIECLRQLAPPEKTQMREIMRTLTSKEGVG